MTVVAEESKESNVSEFPNRLASPEFFYLLQRIDKLDEKMTGEIKAVTGDIKALDVKLSGDIKALDAKLSGDIKALGGTLSGRMDRFEEELRETRRSFTAVVWTGIFGFLAMIVTILLSTKVL